MKKIKLIIMSLAVLLSIGGAFAFRRAPQPSQGIYYWNSSRYMPAGTLGLNYWCSTPSANVCTYNLWLGVYSPYITAAAYTPVP